MKRCPACHASYPDSASDCPQDGHALLPDEAFATLDAPLAPGAMVGEYRVEKKLGSGTFGAVYAGEHPLIGKKVAIKVLHRKFSSDLEIVSRFIAEARAVNRIRHRHIIDIFSFGLLDDRQHYFVMELVDGLTLAELLHQRKRLSVAEALPILRGIAAGLDAAHKAGVTHRDLKPDNIFLATEGDEPYFPKLLDFGVAKLVSEDMAHRTATGLAIGTPRYMAPEQARGKKVDHRADVYALGVVIHQMLTGRCPFDGDSVMDVLLKHTIEPAPRMSSMYAGIPRALDEPVLLMLAKRPAARPNSAGEAIATLTECAQSLGLDQESVPRPGLEAMTAGIGAQVPGAATVALSKADALSDTARSDELQVAVSLGDLGMSDTVESSSVRTAALPVDSSLPVTAPLPGAGVGTGAMAHSPVTGTLRSRGTPPKGGAAASSTGASNGRGQTSPSGRRWAWIGMAAVGVALAGVVMARRTPEQGSEPATAASQASGSAPVVASASPSAATIRFDVTPADAAVLVDGRYAGPASTPLVLPHSTERHAIRIERQGYEPQTLWLVADRDQELSPIALSAVAPASSTTPAHKPPHAVRSGAPSAKPLLHKDLQKPPELGGPR